MSLHILTPNVMFYTIVYYRIRLVILYYRIKVLMQYGFDTIYSETLLALVSVDEGFLTNFDDYRLLCLKVWDVWHCELWSRCRKLLDTCHGFTNISSWVTAGESSRCRYFSSWLNTVRAKSASCSKLRHMWHVKLKTKYLQARRWGNLAFLIL